MYHGKTNSPATVITAGEPRVIGSDEIHIDDVSVLPTEPNICTVGTGDQATTYSYTGKTGTTVGTITGVLVKEGTDDAWIAGTPVARNFTQWDYDAIIDNLDIHNSLHIAIGNPHAEYILHAWADDAENDFLVGTGSETFTKKTLAETKVILLGSATPTQSITFKAGGGGADAAGGCGIYPAKDTAPCGECVSLEASSNDFTLWYLPFSNSADSNAYCLWWSPDNWDASTVKVKFIWTATAGTAAQTVRWGCRGVSISDEQAIDTAFGTAVTIDDAYVDSGRMHITAESGAMTIDGAVAGEPVILNIYRSVAGMTLAQEAKLIGMKLEYTVSSLSE